MVNIGSIAFDWMHRCGKWSQIKLLKDYLNTLNINNISVRWEYYREWSWKNNLEDPESIWRKLNIHNCNYDEKSNRLNRELHILYQRSYPNYLKRNNIDTWVIIQDRSIVGNYLFKYWENNNTNNIDYFSYWKNNLIKKTIIPDLIFLLQPEKEILLKRLYKWFNINEKNAELRLKYKEKYISEKYDEYYKWYELIPEYIKKNIIHIIWDVDKENIHNIVKEKIIEKYQWIIF